MSEINRFNLLGLGTWSEKAVGGRAKKGVGEEGSFREDAEGSPENSLSEGIRNLNLRQWNSQMVFNENNISIYV